MSEAGDKIIRALLKVHEPSAVPGFARKIHDLIVSHARVREIYRADARALGRKRDPFSQPVMEMPADFVEHAARESIADMTARYGVSQSIVSRWRMESGVVPPKHLRGKPVPDGFRIMAQSMTRNEMRKHYGASFDTIDRWLAEMGVKARRAAPGRVPYGQPQSKQQTRRDDSRAGRAADFLRRLGPVVRCDAHGQYSPTGTHWLRGSTVLSADEVIDRALRNGWQPEARRAVA